MRLNNGKTCGRFDRGVYSNVILGICLRRRNLDQHGNVGELELLVFFFIIVVCVVSMMNNANELLHT